MYIEVKSSPRKSKKDRVASDEIAVKLIWGGCVPSCIETKSLK